MLLLRLNSMDDGPTADGPARRRGREVALVVLALWLAGAVGCTGVQRRLTIRTNPPGARVYVDGYDIGTTPASTDFLYYGTREIRIVKDGYETLTVKQPIPTPWFQIPPLDVITDNLLPREIRDERSVTFNLSPQMIVPTEALMDRAEALRQDAQQQASFDSTTIAPSGPSDYGPSPAVQAAPGMFPGPPIYGGGSSTSIGPQLGPPTESLPREGIELSPPELLWPPGAGPPPATLAPQGAPPIFVQ